MTPLVLVTFVELLILTTVIADIYLHNPRGSNNRLDEATRPRANGNRMYDSQNNKRGGYNVGSLFYYQGSLLPIEWTNQHSCHDANSHCELILQYMCHDNVRDGTTVKTIPLDPAQCLNTDCNTDRRYGMHEDWDYYYTCRRRLRNGGLFTADKKPKKTAIGTRQNPGGTRRGYECPEERDYYPYWHPSPWKDIAVLTNNVSRCEYYLRESENVKSRWACVVPQDLLEKKMNVAIPNNKEDCEKFNVDGVTATWKEFPSHGLSAPVCRETEFTRDNHLGNGLGGNPPLFNWTIPNVAHEKCVLRIRYNISTNDYDGWNTNSSHNGKPAKVNMADKYGFSSDTEAENRGYKFQTNPEVKIFDDADFTLRLAIETAQYGRVFQDRSHSFAIRPRPGHIDSDKTIHNLNVRGKRGNIVQVYPSVEYDFVPNTLEMGAGDYVHFQWTGSNTNNRNNDGNGLAGTDRNNIVMQASQSYPEGSGARFGPGENNGHYGNNYPMHVDNGTFLGLMQEDVEKLAFLSTGQFGGEMSQLDDAGTYFNLEPRQISRVGTYNYMCTRNNDFSNRDQKGRVMVYTHPVRYEAIGWMGGSLAMSGSEVRVEQSVFDQLWTMRLEEWSQEEGEMRIREVNGRMNLGDDYVSNFLVVYPQTQLASEGKTFSVEMKLTGGGRNIAIYRSNSANFATWTKVNADISGDVAKFQTPAGGVFVARSSGNVGMIVGIAIMCIIVVIIVIGAIVYFKFHPKKWSSVKKKVKKVDFSSKTQI